MAADDGGWRTRRRGDELLQAIYSAVLSELADTGYGGLTMEGVAARAGTGKAPLYRRWNSKDELILATVQHGLPTSPAPTYSGNVRDDLLHLLRRFAAALTTPFGGAMRALLSETHRRPDLLAALHDIVFQPRGRELRALLRDASDHGEIRPEVIDSHLADIGPEMVMFRFLTGGPPVPDQTIVSILDDVVMPLLRRCGKAEPEGSGGRFDDRQQGPAARDPCQDGDGCGFLRGE